MQASDITGLILAGGQGQRMRGLDKGLQSFQGMPLALRALERLAPQTGQTMISANRNLAAYRAFGAPVVTDPMPGFVGPLAGVLAGFAHCRTPCLLTAPCDAPFLPTDLAARLSAALVAARARIAIPITLEPDAQGRPTRTTQPVFCLYDTALADDLRAYLQDGGRKIDAWTARHASVEVPFDDARAFSNLNTLADLRQFSPSP